MRRPGAGAAAGGAAGAAAGGAAGAANGSFVAAGASVPNGSATSAAGAAALSSPKIPPNGSASFWKTSRSPAIARSRTFCAAALVGSLSSAIFAIASAPRWLPVAIANSAAAVNSADRWVITRANSRSKPEPAVGNSKPLFFWASLIKPGKNAKSGCLASIVVSVANATVPREVEPSIRIGPSAAAVAKPKNNESRSTRSGGRRSV